MLFILGFRILFAVFFGVEIFVVGYFINLRCFVEIVVLVFKI